MWEEHTLPSVRTSDDEEVSHDPLHAPIRVPATVLHARPDHRAALALTGCEARDRAGGDADRDVTVLTFAQPKRRRCPGGAPLWAEQVSDLSDGSLEIEFEDGWRLGEPLYESATIDDIRAGKVDLGWVGARALDRAGISSFQALLAPMLVDSQDLQAEVFEEGIPGEMLEDVTANGDGVTGHRRAGRSAAQAAGCREAVRPARRLRGDDGRHAGLGDRRASVRGAWVRPARPCRAAPGTSARWTPTSSSCSRCGATSTSRTSRYLTANLDLWPRPLVLLANDDSLAALSESQQDALHDAYEASIVGSLDAAREDDESFVDQICASGLDVRQASDADLDRARGRLRAAVRRAARGRADRGVAGPDRRAQVLRRSSPGHDDLRGGCRVGRRRAAAGGHLPQRPHRRRREPRLPAG